MVAPGKDARIERERRFLVATLPDVEPVAERRIIDLYIDGTRMRLRLSVGTAVGSDEIQVVRKLTQKVPAAPGAPLGVQGGITSILLDEAEYERFASLPGRWLTKRRLSIVPMGVDVFEAGLAGLIIAEAEFSTDAEMAAFAPPGWCGREITGDPEFTGGRLASRG